MYFDPTFIKSRISKVIDISSPTFLITLVVLVIVILVILATNRRIHFKPLAGITPRINDIFNS